MTEKQALPHFHLEAERIGSTVSLFLYDVIGLTDFSPEYVKTLLKGGGIAVRGTRLSIEILENHILVVKGRITALEVLYDPT